MRPRLTTLRILTVLTVGIVGGQTQSHAADFAGRVVEDSSGDPVASAELKIRKPGQRELVADLETDRSGRFAGADLPEGDYTIDISKPNYITTTYPAHIPATGMQVRILRYGVMDGKVTNTRGQAVAGRVFAPGGQTSGSTRISLMVKQPGSDDFKSFEDTALEEAGHFRFFDLPPGQYELGMWYYGLKEGSGMQLYPDNTNPRIFTVAGGEVYNNLDFLIAPNPQYNVTGRVELPAPKMRFALALGLPEHPALPVAQANADTDGNFTFEKIPAGTYDLFAAGPTGGYTAFESVLDTKAEVYYGRVRIQVAGADMTNVAVPVSPGPSLSVVLRAHPTGPPPPACPQSATVTVTPMEPWGIAFFSASVQAGFAREQTIQHLAPGRFRIKANGLGPGCYQVNNLEVDAGRDVEQPVAVQLAAAGSITGKLGTTKDHAKDFIVVLLDPTAGHDVQSQLALPDADGKFRFETLPPGRYRLAAQPVAASSKSRWVANVAQMTEVDVTGGSATDIVLPAAQTGGTQ